MDYARNTIIICWIFANLAGFSGPYIWWKWDKELQLRRSIADTEKLFYYALFFLAGPFGFAYALWDLWRMYRRDAAAQ